MTLDTQSLRPLFTEWARIMEANKSVLTELDSVVGDGDLGLTMSDGFAAAARYAQQSEERDLGRFFYMAGKAMASAVPSTMGTLMASGLMQAGKAFKGRETLGLTEAGVLFQAWYDGVQQRGKAHLLGADGVHLFSNDLFHLVVNTQTQRQPRVDAGCDAPDVAGSDEPAVTGNLGVRRVFAQGAHEQLAHSGDHGFSSAWLLGQG